MSESAKEGVKLTPLLGSQQYREEDREKYSEALVGGNIHRSNHVLLRKNKVVYANAVTKYEGEQQNIRNEKMDTAIERKDRAEKQREA